MKIEAHADHKNGWKHSKKKRVNQTKNITKKQKIKADQIKKQRRKRKKRVDQTKKNTLRTEKREKWWRNHSMLLAHHVALFIRFKRKGLFCESLNRVNLFTKSIKNFLVEVNMSFDDINKLFVYPSKKNIICFKIKTKIEMQKGELKNTVIQ